MRTRHIMQFLGFHHLTVYRLKRGLKRRKILKIRKIDTNSLYSLIRSLGFNPKPHSKIILFIFRSKKHYYKNTHLVKEIMKNYPSYHKRIIIIRDLEQTPNNRGFNCLFDLFTFRYNEVLVYDFANNPLFINTLRAISTFSLGEDIVRVQNLVEK